MGYHLGRCELLLLPTLLLHPHTSQIKDIQDCLANDLVDEVSDRLENVRTDEDDMILGGFRPITLDKACFLLPPRPVADKLLSRYFGARYLHIRVFDPGQFMDLADPYSVYP